MLPNWMEKTGVLNSASAGEPQNLVFFPGIFKNGLLLHGKLAADLVSV